MLESRLGGSKPSDDVFRTKNGGFYNQLWENGCRIRTKIKSYSMSRLGGPIMPCLRQNVVEYGVVAKKYSACLYRLRFGLRAGADAEFIFSPYIAIQQNLSLYMPTGADIRLLLLAVL